MCDLVHLCLFTNIIPVNLQIIMLSCIPKLCSNYSSPHNPDFNSSVEVSPLLCVQEVRFRGRAMQL